MNTSWLVYLNLENELKDCFNYVYFNDNVEQQKVYSNKFADIVLRASIEIETLAKELYKINGGTKPLDKKPKFDDDCIDLLNKKFSLDKKVVFITYPFFDFKKEESKEITPFSHTEMTDSNCWQKAYQEIKHDKLTHYKKGNLKNALHSVAALYLLNVYLKNEKFTIKHGDAYKFDTRFGSTLFSLDKPSDKTGIVFNAYINERSVYEYKLTKDSKEERERRLINYFNECVDYLNNIPERNEEKYIELLSSLKEKFKGLDLVNNCLNELAKYRVDKQFENLSLKDKIIKLSDLLNDNSINESNFEERYFSLIIQEQIKTPFLFEYYNIINFSFSDALVELSIAFI